MSPPITARRAGVLFPAFAEAQAHRQHAEEHRSAVVSTGRRRVRPAASCRPRIEAAELRRTLFVRKVTMRMLFDVATPIAMMQPMSAGTLIVVCVTNSAHKMPARAAAPGE